MKRENLADDMTISKTINKICKEEADVAIYTNGSADPVL